MDWEPLVTLAVRLAGIAQIVLIIGSLAIPKVLGWKGQLAANETLIRQMFWVYAGYIWATNLSFGLLSALAPQWLLDGSPLSAVVAGFICAYWAARVVIQLVYFDVSGIPRSPFNTFARWALEVLFAALTLIYGLATAITLRGGF